MTTSQPEQSSHKSVLPVPSVLDKHPAFKNVIELPWIFVVQLLRQAGGKVIIDRYELESSVTPYGDPIMGPDTPQVLWEAQQDPARIILRLKEPDDD